MHQQTPIKTEPPAPEEISATGFAAPADAENLREQLELIKHDMDTLQAWLEELEERTHGLEQISLREKPQGEDDFVDLEAQPLPLKPDAPLGIDETSEVWARYLKRGPVRNQDQLIETLTALVRAGKLPQDVNLEGFCTRFALPLLFLPVERTVEAYLAALAEEKRAEAQAAMQDKARRCPPKSLRANAIVSPEPNYKTMSSEAFRKLEQRLKRGLAAIRNV